MELLDFCDECLTKIKTGLTRNNVLSLGSFAPLRSNCRGRFAASNLSTSARNSLALKESNEADAAAAYPQNEREG
jgi:hypothetical protein